MKEIIYNYDNLTEEEIDEVIIRIKALIINSKNEILLGYCHQTYQFPGGHQEEGETFLECLKREIEEETGININLIEKEPFFIIKHYGKNYKNTGKNRCSEIYYFEIKTDEKYNLSNSDYTENEKVGNYKLKYINLNDVENILIQSVPLNEQNEVIVKEMLEIIKEYKLTKID